MVLERVLLPRAARALDTRRATSCESVRRLEVVAITRLFTRWGMC